MGVRCLRPGAVTKTRLNACVGDEIDVSRISEHFTKHLSTATIQIHTNVIKYIYCRPSSGTGLPSEQTLVSLVRRSRLLTDAAINSDNNLVVFA